MFKIGDFARLARVSPRLLRWYEEVGLLVPAQVDSASGYRYYSASQLVQLNRILALKELGLSLEQIAAMLDTRTPGEKLRALLEERKAQAERDRSEETLRIVRIETRLRQIEALGTAQGGDVVLAPGRAQRMLCVREQLPSFVAVGALMTELLETLPGHVSHEALGHFAVIAHTAEFEPEQFDLELGFFVSAETTTRIELRAGRCASTVDLPVPELVASCVRVGPPEQAHMLAAEIAFFVETGGLQLAGPGREVFLQRPRWDRIDQSVIEMQFPVAREGTGAITAFPTP